MSSKNKKVSQDYLREARIQAGFASMEVATTAVPYSKEAIGRHERGEVEIAPDDAIVYADCYDNPSILMRYCTTCPVGRRIGRTATDRQLPHATLRVRKLIEDAQDVADRLEEIAFDGVIDDAEREDFRKALEFLQQLEAGISDIILIGLEDKKSGQRRKRITELA